MSFCLQRQRGSLIPPQAWAMCRMSIGTKSMTKNKPEGQAAEQLPKMRELMEDFWELQELIFVFTRSLKADGLAVLLFQILLLGCFELFQVFED